MRLVTGVLQFQFHNLSGQLKATQSKFIAKKLKKTSTLKIKSQRNLKGTVRVYDFNAKILRAYINLYKGYKGLYTLETSAFDSKYSQSVFIIGELS